MSDAPFPRDDRAWPRGAFTFSLVCGLAALVGSATLVASADSPSAVVEVGLVFVVMVCLETVAYVAALKPWLRGRSTPPRAAMIQISLLVLAFVTFAGGPATGGAGLCGFAAGMFLPNAALIRHARGNRALVDRGEALLAKDRSQEQPSSQFTASAATERQPRTHAVPGVGAVLRETVAEDRDRCLAWAAATVAVAVGCVAIGATVSLLFGIVFVGVAALAWVARRFLGARLALRDFERAAFAPRRAHVVLFDDPNPRVTRPLLGVWNEEPVPSGGRLPRARAVYRCDEKRSALISMQGAVVVHEAWLDTGVRVESRPRWVCADAGIALPHRRAMFGRWYLASMIGSERPARARPLTIPAPNPTTEAETGTVATVISEPRRETGRWFRMFAWRLAGLALTGAVFVLFS